MSVQVVAVGKEGIQPLTMPEGFRHEVAYFMALPDEDGVPELPHGEYWIRLSEARDRLEDGVVSIVSPLDSENRTEFEISEDHEMWLEWMVEHEIQHIRLS